MARTTKQTKTPATPGFAIEIKDDTELGLAILVAEFGDGNYQPVEVVVSINEAREIADSDMRDPEVRLQLPGATWSGPRESAATPLGVGGATGDATTLNIWRHPNDAQRIDMAAPAEVAPGTEIPEPVGHRSRPTIPTSMIDRRRNLQHYPEPGPGSKTPRIATSLGRSKQPSGYGREYWLQT